MLYRFFKNNRVMVLPENFISSLLDKPFDEQCRISRTWSTKNKNNWAHFFLIVGKDRKVLPSSYTLMRNLHNSYKDDVGFQKMMQRVLNAKNSERKTVWHLLAEDLEHSFGLLNEFSSYYGIKDINARTNGGFSIMDIVVAKVLPTYDSPAIFEVFNENFKNCFLNLVSLNEIDWNGGSLKSLRDKIYLLPDWAREIVVPALDRAVLDNKIPEAKDSLKKLRV